MPASAIDTAACPIETEILASGAALPDAAVPVEIEVSAFVDRIPSARIRIAGTTPEGLPTEVSDGSLLVPGTEIEIKAGRQGTKASLFKGIVVRHGIRMGRDGTAVLDIECRHKAVKMTVVRKSENHKEKSDADVIKALVAAYGLSVSVDDTSGQHETLVQQLCSDWDFLVARAEANGLLVLCQGDSVKVTAPALSEEAVLTLTYGKDLLEYEARLESHTQLAGAKGVAWDLAKQDVSVQEASPGTTTGQGNLDSAALAKICGGAKPELGACAFSSDLAASGWAKAVLVKAGLARIRGRATFPGNALPVPGSLVELAEVGARFNGKAFVGGVRHDLRLGEWTTEVEIGMAPQWHAAEEDVSAPRAFALAAASGGLQIGKVMKIDADPKSMYRIQVKLPLMRAQTEGIWARMAHPVASNGFGCAFLPEVDDEVVVGFFDEDPSAPVVLGFLYSGKNKPALEPAADNNVKSFTSRSKITLSFDDDKKILTVETPGKNQVVLSDEGKSVLLKDQNGNQVKLSDAGITIDSAKDIVIKAAGKLSLKSTGNLESESSADLKGKGLNVAFEGQVGLTAKGSATAELSAGGQTTVKGAMVMIN
jgi:Rhs element Vgr protein